MSARANAPMTASGIPLRMRVLSGALLILRSLGRGWRRAEELSEEHGIHRRVVYRHLAAMRHIGIRLEREREEKEVYWHVPSDEIARWLGEAPDAPDRQTPEPRKCTIPGCGRPHMNHGLCQTHSARLRRGKSLAAPVRLQRSYSRAEIERALELAETEGPVHAAEKLKIPFPTLMGWRIKAKQQE